MLPDRGVHSTLPVTPWEAALGATVEPRVPDGMVEMRIPAGSQSGRKLRLKGRGIPGSTAGDLYLVLDVVLPPASNPKARALYQTMSQRTCVQSATGTHNMMKEQFARTLEDARLTLDEVAVSCSVSREWVIEHVQAGILLGDTGADSDVWLFNSRDMLRARVRHAGLSLD